MRSLLILAFALLLPSLAHAQGKKETGPLPEVDLKRKDPVAYEKDVEPVFYKKCIACHSGAVKEGRLDLGSYEGLMKGGKNGPVFMAGKSKESKIHKMMLRVEKPFMPPRGEEPCVAEEVALVKLWIDQGAKAPSGVRAPDKIIVNVPNATVQPVRALAVSPDKSLVATGRGNKIHIYDAGSGAYVRTLFDPALKAPDGKPVQASHLSLVESMAYSPDGKYLASGSFQEISIWDPLTGQLRHKITGFAHAVVALAFSLDSQLLGTAGGVPTVEGEVKVFEVGTWKLYADIKNCHSDTVYGLAFSPVIDMPEPGAKTPDPKDKNPPKVKTTPMTFLATCSADKFVKVWEVPSAKFVKSFEGHTHHVLDVGWMADGKLLASAGGDNTVKIWDFDKGEQARTINAHAKQVTRLLFIGTKAEFLTSGGDNQVKAFNASNGGNIRNFAGAADFIYAIGASPDGSVVAAGGQEGIVRVYNGTSGAITRTLLPPDAQPPMKIEKK